jgi:hypothetical protein
MTLIASSFLAGSLLSLLLPTIMLTALIVWYVKFIREVPDTTEEELASASAGNPGAAAAPASASNPGPAGGPGGAAPSGGAAPPGTSQASG